MSNSKFNGCMIIHCPERMQAEWLASEVSFPERNSPEEMLAGWDKYREKTVFCVMAQPHYGKPTVIWLCSSDDECVQGKDIIEYSSL